MPDAANLAEWNRLFRDQPLARPHHRDRDCQQFPTDLDRYVEVIYALEPPFIIEVGRGDAGTALFLADQLDGDAFLISIDVHGPQPPHKRIVYLTGDSTSPDVIAAVHALTGDRRGLVLLDGDHGSDQVRRELAAYADLADYLVVEDTIMADLGFNDGPHTALAAWLPTHPEFEVDPDPVFTQHPGGWLHRA